MLPKCGMVSNLSIKHLFKALQWDKCSSKDFTITCYFRMFDSAIDTCEDVSNKKIKSGELLVNISNLLEDQVLKDITFSVQGKKFKAHKAILAARSPVFSAMFTHKMKERIKSCVEIQDLEPDIFEKMLRFIYTDKVNDLEESASKLLPAAERYDLQKLKRMCVTILHRSLTIKNVLETLKLADMFSISDLRRAALKFIISHPEIVNGMEEFENLIESRPRVALELIRLQKKGDSNYEGSFEKIKKTDFEFRH
ncbi:speckle-type POZ protein-like isoform X2 [Belonocnema kinseyi]|nr:speckle-type POZ protein-like isoform X2 [Belonocnema kinseyi]